MGFECFFGIYLQQCMGGSFVGSRFGKVLKFNQIQKEGIFF